jgi:hypothetical protein
LHNGVPLVGLLVDLSAEECVPKPLNILTVSLKEWNAGYISSKKDRGASSHARRYTSPSRTLANLSTRPYFANQLGGSSSHSGSHSDSNAIARFKANNSSHNEVATFFWENTRQPISFSRGTPIGKLWLRTEIKSATGTDHTD